MSRQLLQVRSISLCCSRASLKCSRHSESFSGITRFMPRYSTLGIFSLTLPSPHRGEGESLVVHDEGGAGRRHRPAEIHGDLGVLDLSALPRGVVVAVLALSRTRAVVVHPAAELAHVLDDHAHAVGVALAEMAARRVVGPLAPQLDDAARDVGAAFALLAEA